jgi:hypothetical protein
LGFGNEPVFVEVTNDSVVVVATDGRDVVFSKPVDAR